MLTARPKDFDTMMGYLEADSAPDHAVYAWHYQSKRAAGYIRKLEKKVCELELRLKELQFQIDHDREVAKVDLRDRG